MSLKIIAIFLVTFAASACAAPPPHNPAADQPGYPYESTTTPCPPFDLKQKLDNVKEKVKEAGKAIGKTFVDVKLALKNKLDKITGKNPPPSSSAKPPAVHPPVHHGEPTLYPNIPPESESGFTSGAPEYDFQPYSEVAPTYNTEDEPSQPVDDVIAEPVDNFYRISGSKS